jgi:hypothetical protein
VKNLIILALDSLDINLLLRYKNRYLKQEEYGLIDISDFKILRTVVLWASFLSGKNMEHEIPLDTVNLWRFRLETEKTFFQFFDSYKAIDVPAFSLKQQNHSRERSFMRKYFDDEISVEDFDSLVWRNHERNKKDFFKSLGKFDLVMGYFDIADAIGHLSFGITKKMKEVYIELDKIAKEVKSSFEDFILIASDHGMKQNGRYGEHCYNGFYSMNNKLKISFPKIIDFYNLIKKVVKNTM